MAWRPSLGDTAALSFVFIAVVLGALAAWGDSLDGWALNLATEALGIAATVLIIERILRIEERRRRAPRVNAALEFMNVEFCAFLDAVAHDYATTHREGEVPREPFELLDRWLDGQDRADAPHVELWPWGETLRDLGWKFAWYVRQLDYSDRDVLEPDLVAAIRDLHRGVRGTRERLSVLRQGPPPQIAEAVERLSYRAPVRRAREFGMALRRYGYARCTLPDDEIAFAEEMRTARFAGQYPPAPHMPDDL